MHVVVVGGGITGLTAAWTALSRARELGREARITVLEEQPRLGGQLVTERVEGFLLDGGPDSWVRSKPHATALARELGLGDALIETNEGARRFFILWDGRLHAVPEGLVLGVPTRVAPLVRTSLFSWRGKLRMGLEPFVPRRSFEGDDDESIASFARRRLGREAAERLVAPLLGGISAGDADEISVRAAFPQLVAMEQEHGSLVLGTRAAKAAGAGARAGAGAKPPSAFLSLRGGVGELPRALAERLGAAGVSLRCGVAARAIARRERGTRVTLDDGAAIDADALVLAVPPRIAAVLLADVDGDVGRGLAAIPHGSTATVFLAYRASDVTHPLDGVGFVVPRVLGRPLLAGTWVSSKWAGRAPPGHVLIRGFVGGPAGEALLARDDAALASLVREELRALMQLDARPLFSRVFRFDRGRPQMRVGHLALMRELHGRLAETTPGLRLAGDGYDGASISDCVRQGREVGRAIVS